MRYQVEKKQDFLTPSTLISFLELPSPSLGWIYIIF